MAMNIENKTVSFEGIIYEDEVVTLRDFLQTQVPEPIIFVFQEAQDVHLAVLQEVLAYKKLYECTCNFGNEMTTYQKLIEGFETIEDNCS